jgi:rhamnulokinase
MGGTEKKKMNPDYFLAFDIGAESGRALLGELKKNQIQVEEIHRFKNRMILKQGHLVWDVYDIFKEVKTGLRKYGNDHPEPLRSMAVDTWGVDFGLFDKKGDLISLPFAYRDKRNKKAMEEFLKKISPKKIYELTGIQFLQFNSIFQLYAVKTQNPEIMDKASDLLFMPDIFNYFLTGKMSTEFSYATTSQLFNPIKNSWEESLFKVLEVPVSIMKEVETGGKKLGLIKKSTAKDVGIKPHSVVLTAAHDTASAVAAVPAQGNDWAFISSGTWSIMGVELNSPLITEESFKLNFTNEGGLGHRFRLSKNITGLWLLQECRKKWSVKRKMGYGELMKKGHSSKPFRSLVDPDHPLFLKSPDMTKAIVRFCQESGQPSPKNTADFVRCILESLALKYRYVFDELCFLSPHPIRKIHIIGGGSRNHILCQFTANALGIPVISGPAEATGVGNIMIQALAENRVDSLENMRSVISDSFDLQVYMPERIDEWEKNYERFRKLCEGGFIEFKKN